MADLHFNSLQGHLNSLNNTPNLVNITQCHFNVTQDDFNDTQDYLNSTQDNPNATEGYSNFTGHLTGNSDLSANFMTFYFSVRMLWSSFILFGNLLTIIAVGRFHFLQKPTNYLICSLAMADLIGGTLPPLVIIQAKFSSNYAYVPLCLIEKGISLTSSATNVMSIMWLAVDRYIFIAHGLTYSTWMTPTRTFKIIGITWFVVGLEVVVCFSWGNRMQVGTNCKMGTVLVPWVYSWVLMPQLVAVFFTTIGMHVAVARIAYKQGLAITAQNLPYDTQESANNRQQKKIIKMLFLILGTFLACYIPQIIMSLVMSLSSETNSLMLQLEMLTVLILWCNSWINPLIYAWKTQHFRIAFRRLLNAKGSSHAISPSFDIPTVSAS